MKLSKAIAAVSLVTLTALGSNLVSAADKIRIATEGAYAPFNMTNEAGEPIGFDVDIANALCAQMQAE